MNVAIIGTGYVGRAFETALRFHGCHPTMVSRSMFDYYDREKLSKFLRHPIYNLVINAVGYTGRSVDDCERNTKECMEANVGFVSNLAFLCDAYKTNLFQVSTGCMFNGPGPFKEEDEPNFTKNFYQWCKRRAEHSITLMGTRAWIFRIRMPFSEVWHPHNWLVKLCNYDVILDGLNSVTCLDDFCFRSFLAWRNKKIEPGIYHWTNPGPIRTSEVADLLVTKGWKKPFTLWSPEAFLKLYVKRSECVLDCSKFSRATGIAIDEAMPSIRQCIAKLGRYPVGVDTTRRRMEPVLQANA